MLLNWKSLANFVLRRQLMMVVHPGKSVTWKLAHASQIVNSVCRVLVGLGRVMLGIVEFP